LSLASNSEGETFKFLFINVEEEDWVKPKELDNLNIAVYPRAMPRAKNGMRSVISGILQAIFGLLPRAAAVVSSDKLSKELGGRIAKGDVSLIVVDHLTIAPVAVEHAGSIPIVYIAHNIETNIIDQQLEYEPSAAKKIFLYIQYWKMRRLETRVLGLSSKIICIAPADANNTFISKYSKKVAVWPELPEEKAKQWSFSGNKRLLFVGSASYFPNFDAIRWLCENLMPKVGVVDSSIILHFVGTSLEQVKGRLKIPNNVVFEGFVSSDELETMHLKADLFICPVTLGSGVKIKLLEAASYGLPIAADVRSLEGIEFLDGNCIEFDRENTQNNVDQLANNLISKLANQGKLEFYSSQVRRALSGQRRTRKMLAAELKI